MVNVIKVFCLMFNLNNAFSRVILMEFTNSDLNDFYATACFSSVLGNYGL